MKIVAFGDSFTAGEGTNYDYTEPLDTFEEKEEYQKSHSWPRYLSELMGVGYLNHGEIGSTNHRILSHIFDQYADKKINKDDLVIIMWSSPIRDHLPFFPTMWSRSGPVGLGWSLKELSLPLASELFNHRFYENKFDSFPHVKDYIENDLRNFMDEHYFEYFMKNLYDEFYYEFLSTNYVVFLQEYFKHKNQKYIMCDAFEKLTFDINLVDTKNYYRDKTALDILDDNGGDVFEKHIHNKDCHGAMHPNINGHKLIAKELKGFLDLCQ